jgi:hypothetical protein
MGGSETSGSCDKSGRCVIAAERPLSETIPGKLQKNGLFCASESYRILSLSPTTPDSSIDRQVGGLKTGKSVK